MLLFQTTLVRSGLLVDLPAFFIKVLIQTAEGSDPNLSALLGIRSDVTSLADDPSRDDDDAPPLASVEQTNKSITDVRKLRRDLDQLRSTITNRYAENIGDNCTTQ